jgi:hypothetical protein
VDGRVWLSHCFYNDRLRLVKKRYQGKEKNVRKDKAQETSFSKSSFKRNSKFSRKSSKALEQHIVAEPLEERVRENLRWDQWDYPKKKRYIGFKTTKSNALRQALNHAIILKEYSNEGYTWDQYCTTRWCYFKKSLIKPRNDT